MEKIVLIISQMPSIFSVQPEAELDYPPAAYITKNV